MKKYLCFVLFFLFGCAQTLEVDSLEKSNNKDFNVAVGQVEAVSFAPIFDGLPHVEKQMATLPQDVIIKWSQQHLIPQKEDNRTLWIVVHQAEMIRQDNINSSWYRFDEETYILSYSVELTLKQGSRIIRTLPITGKGFVNIVKKASLSQKENGWDWLVQKMIEHIQTRLITDFDDVIFER